MGVLEAAEAWGVCRIGTKLQDRAREARVRGRRHWKLRSGSKAVIQPLRAAVGLGDSEAGRLEGNSPGTVQSWELSWMCACSPAGRGHPDSVKPRLLRLWAALRLSGISGPIFPLGSAAASTLNPSVTADPLTARVIFRGCFVSVFSRFWCLRPSSIVVNNGSQGTENAQSEEPEEQEMC